MLYQRKHHWVVNRKTAHKSQNLLYRLCYLLSKQEMVLMQTERQDLFPEQWAVEVYSYRVIASGAPRSMQCFHPPPHPGRNFPDDFYAAYVFWLLKDFKIGDKYTNIIHTNRTYMSNITRALNSPIWPLGSFQPFSLPFALSVLFPGPAQLKDKFIPARVLRALMKSAVKLPSCSCLAAGSDGHLSAASPSQTRTKTPLMGCLSPINLHLLLLDFSICFSVIWFYIQCSLTLLIN